MQTNIDEGAGGMKTHSANFARKKSTVSRVLSAIVVSYKPVSYKKNVYCVSALLRANQHFGAHVVMRIFPFVSISCFQPSS